MLIYPTFYQQWVDSYVKCSIIYKNKYYQQEKNQHGRQNQKNMIVISKCSRLTFWFEKCNMQILSYRNYILNVNGSAFCN